ncbi:hypothetical protein RM844_25690 [Streptomyces sp. DSM 44915]|uniref:Uncharacterized protein n=1 Tax=Streptomyces chisholmiae TaxID=3075540 RepID=A0ABU2JXF8_9ACTN|nr:hypothetical protein [Streptomyces sp. DSM 44915]MDT0269681.1 hypothetical protein [Streptomyces sp. DSM 44915]
MTDTDPYRLAGDAEEAPRATGSPVSRGQILRALLWAVLVVSVAGNTVVSLSAEAPALHIALGVVTGLCVTALAVQSLRRSR